MNDLFKVIDFISLCERLKTELRHGKTSSGRNESVAEHCWRVALMVILVAPYLEEKINLEKALKMAIIHDLPEIITGDKPYFYFQDKKSKEKKHAEERIAMLKLCKDLPKKFSKEFFLLWLEYEQSNSKEARLVKALDKMEAQIQHNNADISVWNEFDRKFVLTFLNKYCDFDINLKKLRMRVQDISEQKLQAFGIEFKKDFS